MFEGTVGIKALFVDYDGTVVDSHDVGMRGRKDIAEKYDLPWNLSFHAEYTGCHNEDYYAALYQLAQEQGQDISQLPSLQEIAQESRVHYLGRYAPQATMYPYVEEFFQALQQQGVLIYGYTNSSVQQKSIMEKLPFGQYLTHSLCREEVEHGKPAPDGYNHLLRVSGCSAQEVCVLEDSSTGVESAMYADLPTIVMTHGWEEGYVQPKAWEQWRTVRGYANNFVQAWKHIQQLGK